MLQRWLSVRNRRGYVGPIFDDAVGDDRQEDGDVVESIEHEDETEKIAETLVTHESGRSHGNAVQPDELENIQEASAFGAASVDVEHTQITETETDVSYLEDTSLLIQNHTPTNPFIANTIPPQSRRRQQTPFATRVPLQSSELVQNPFVNTSELAATPFHAVNTIRRDSFSRTRDLDDEEAMLDDEDSFERQDSETSIVTQIHIQEDFRKDMGGEDTLEIVEDEIMLD